MDRPFMPKYGTVSQVLLQLVAACLISCEISLFVTAENREGILLETYIREFGVALPEELEVNK